MHKGFRYILTGFIVISFGVIIMLIGLAHDGQNNLGWHNGHFEVSQIKTVHREVKFVNKIDIETDNVPVIFQTSKQKNVTIAGRITNPDFLHVVQSGHQLKIHYIPNQEKGYEVGFGKHEPEKLIVTIPADKKLNEYRQSAMDGMMTISNLQATRAILTASDSDIHLNQTKLHSLSVSAHSATVALKKAQVSQTTLNGSDSHINTDQANLGRLMLSADESKVTLQQTTADTSAIQMTSGHVKLLDSQLTGHNIMTIMDGSLKVVGLSNVGLQMQTTAGHIKVNGTNYGTNYLDDLATNNQLNVDVSDGNITVK